MGLVKRTPLITDRMLKLIVATCLLALVGASHDEPDLRMTCEECVYEMEKLGYLIKGEAHDISAYLQEFYCPSVADIDMDRCKEDLAGSYVAMLEMVINHFFVDGAIHICMAWGVCMPKYAAELVGKEPRPYTCEECVEGLEWVQGYMEDPLWVAEYTLYLEQNFCVGRPDVCVEFVAQHFPPMHAMAIGEFWKPQELCAQQSVCGGEQPTKPPMY